MLHAVIDIGSNSIKLLVGELGTDGRIAVAHDEVVVTELSRGVDRTGLLDAESVAHSLAVIDDYLATARGLGALPIVAGGTSALRDATNSNHFIDACEERGLTVELITGDAEALIVRLAANREMPDLPDDAVLIDIGGGSAELVWAEGRFSTELGVRRLTERHVPGDPPGAGARAAITAHARRIFDELRLPESAPQLVGTSASVAILGKLSLEMTTFDQGLLHGHLVELAELLRLTARLETSTHDERVGMAGMDPARADVIFAGAVVVTELAQRLGVPGVRICTRGTRYGMFHRAFGAPS